MLDTFDGKLSLSDVLSYDISFLNRLKQRKIKALVNENKEKMKMQQQQMQQLSNGGKK